MEFGNNTSVSLASLLQAKPIHLLLLAYGLLAADAFSVTYLHNNTAPLLARGEREGEREGEKEREREGKRRRKGKGKNQSFFLH